MAEEVGVEESGLIILTIQNVVSTFDVGCKLNLKAIAMKAQNAEYKQNRLGALIMRIREPKTTALIFNSGKVICAGAKSEESSKLAARKYGRIIQKLGFPVKFSDFRILNVVSSCDVKFPVRLEMLKAYHYTFADYDPEVFPGLINRMVQPKVTILVFVSGKVVLTGAKTKAQALKAFDNIYPIVAEYRKKPRII